MLSKKKNKELALINLSQEEKRAIDKGIQSIEAGRVKSNQEVVDMTRKKYDHLFK